MIIYTQIYVYVGSPDVFSGLLSSYSGLSLLADVLSSDLVKRRR